MGPWRRTGQVLPLLGACTGSRYLQQSFACQHSALLFKHEHQNTHLTYAPKLMNGVVKSTAASRSDVMVRSVIAKSASWNMKWHEFPAPQSTSLMDKVGSCPHHLWSECWYHVHRSFQDSVQGQAARKSTQKIELKLFMAISINHPLVFRIKDILKIWG